MIMNMNQSKQIRNFKKAFVLLFLLVLPLMASSQSIVTEQVMPGESWFLGQYRFDTMKVRSMFE